ncbi:MAG TPA: amidohydrolase family protein [Amycolatopsis sp.]|uniref:amidohydrolase family protein n=1 Tax=Amycolatopsis sp. TaxID=37632 RepID=UPI002B48E1F7|nr:amidohydrolase family protein [Amycolatopsis sp.]HJQ48785.1 amidohydrolase family protein [Amycolatopsis sp.]HKS50213.1 amidohydrolase family protein [Amycolatopsis sp.]
MQDKVALEEHFATSDTVEDSRRFVPPGCWEELRSRLLDVHDSRIKEMDENGIELSIVSLNAPAVQAVPQRRQAEELARRANDELAAQVARSGSRLRAFAALPLQDPDSAAAELRRAVTELGMVGALVNGFSEAEDHEGPQYYDAPRYRGFWAEVARLDVPVYLHPRNPLPADARIYAGHEWLLGPTWAFAQETAVHALRLMGSGLFDEHPNLAIILGHLGEGLTFNMWRVDNRNSWTGQPPRHNGRRSIREYFRSNFYLTTSGNFHTPALRNAIAEVGVEKMLFSTDWPFENMDHAAVWFDQLGLTPAEQVKIGRDNARRLFKLE